MTGCDNALLVICKNCAFWNFTHSLPTDCAGIVAFGGCTKIGKPTASHEECHRYVRKGA